MYKINFNHLYYFLTIAKEGSIVKASKKLHLTQPALSHQLKLLEEDLGKKLFDRVGKRLVINEDGEAVKEYASKIFRHSEEMLEFLKSESREIVKIIKIGVVPWIPNELTYEFLKPLIASQFIKVEVYQKDLDTLFKDVHNNRLDLILCDSPYSGRSKKLQGHRLMTEPIFCVSSTKSGFRGSFPKSIEGKKAISFSYDGLLADKIDEFLMKNKVNLQMVGSFTDLSLIKTVSTRGFVSFLPKTSVLNEIKKKELVKIGELDKLKFSLWAITRKDYKQDGLLATTIKNFLKSQT